VRLPSCISRLLSKRKVESSEEIAEIAALEISPELLKLKLDQGWRQGTVLSVESSKKLVGKADVGEEFALIVVTQTCDLLYHSLKIEPTVELLHAEIRNGAAPKRAGKSFREIELQLDNAEEAKHLYVAARPKLEICRHKLFEVGVKHEWQPTKDILPWFSRWLGEKYSRPAFPNAFDSKLGKGKDQIANAVKNLQSCRGLYIGLSSWAELSEEENYQVSIVLLLDHTACDEDGDKAESAYTKIFKVFEDAGHVVNEETSAVKRDDEVTISEFYALRKWSLDYISIRDPSHKAPPTG
jgi:hypothetical protein